MKSIIQIHEREKKFKKIFYTPTSNHDTFMSCVSYWVYRTTGKSECVRKKLLLFFAKKCFQLDFKTINHVVNHATNICVEFYKNDFVNNVTDARNFIFTNTRLGIISSIDIMCMVVSEYYKIYVRIIGHRTKCFGNIDYWRHSFNIHDVPQMHNFTGYR